MKNKLTLGAIVLSLVLLGASCKKPNLVAEEDEARAAWQDICSRLIALKSEVESMPESLLRTNVYYYATVDDCVKNYLDYEAKVLEDCKIMKTPKEECSGVLTGFRKYMTDMIEAGPQPLTQY